MSLASSQRLHRWETLMNRPFWRLVKLFLERMFRGGGDNDTEGIDLGIGVLLTILAMPGGFVSIILFGKYGSLLQWLRGQSNIDNVLIALPDEYFFIVLSMTVTGAVAVWKWDAIFPDRRDYTNLAHLPISNRTIFGANLLSVFFLAALLAVDVNIASSVLFPMVVTGAQWEFLPFLKFAEVHAVGVFLASVFTFFTVFSILGLAMCVLPPRAFRSITAWLRGLLVIYLTALLSTSLVVPQLLSHQTTTNSVLIFALPSTWFVSLCQSLHGKANPAMFRLARLCIPTILASVGIAVVCYAAAYYRHFMRIAETSEGTTAPWRVVLHHDFIASSFLRTPFQRACLPFASKSLLRSEAHRLILTGVAGLALVFATQSLMIALEQSQSWREAALRPGALSIPFILTFLLISGLRIAFEIPVELRANWIFQLMLDPDRHECEPLARKMIFLVVLAWISGCTWCMYFWLEGLRVAVIHTTVVLTSGMLLTNLLLVNFRKIPFTCSKPVFKQHSIVIFIVFCFGYLLYAFSIPEFEASAISKPVQMLKLLPLAAVTWFVTRLMKNSKSDAEKKLTFEETAVQTIDQLRLMN